MLEALLLLTGLGLLLASRKRMGPANPYQLYFCVWFFVFLGYYATQETFIEPQPIFLFSIFVSIGVAFVLLIATTLQRESRKHLAPSLNNIEIKETFFVAAQFTTSLALAPVFLRAQTLSGGESVFTTSGYIALRSAMTNEGQSFGLLSYFFPLAFVLASLAIILYRQQRAGLATLSTSLATGIFYAYLSTGRTFVLLLFCLSTFPLIVTKTIRIKSLLLYSPIVFLAFIFIALMTGKGVSDNDGVTANVLSFSNSLRSYTIAPFLALSEVFNQELDSALGANSLRFFVSIFYAIGITDTPPVPLIRDYVNTPDPTNVYTVYEVYIRDFLTAGLFIPPAFLLAHQFLYSNASRIGGVWIFYYTASTYPLLMQFFQDQYSSLLSQWIQIAFWYFMLVENRRTTRMREFQNA